jgi:hypothetical protein
MSIVWFTAGSLLVLLPRASLLQRLCHAEIRGFAGFPVASGSACGKPCRVKTAECRDSMVHLNHSLTMPA